MPSKYDTTATTSKYDLSTSQASPVASVGILDVIKEIPGTISGALKAIRESLRVVPTTQELEDKYQMSFLPTEIERLKKEATEKQGFIYAGNDSAIDPSFGVGGMENMAKTLLKNLVRESRPDKIFKELIEAGIDKHKAALVSKPLAEAKTEGQVFEILRNEGAPPEPSPYKPLDTTDFARRQQDLFPDELAPLAEEARKYKSAEEFVGSRPKIYHGTAENFDEFDPSKLGKSTGARSAREGFFFTDNPSVADDFGQFSREKKVLSEVEKKRKTELESFMHGLNGKKRRELTQSEGAEYDSFIEKIKSGPLEIKEYSPNFSNPKVIDMEGRNRTPGDFTDALRAAKKEGYDAVIFKNAHDTPFDNSPSNVTVVFDPSKVLSKSQLTDFWKKAKGIDVIEQLDKAPKSSRIYEDVEAIKQFTKTPGEELLRAPEEELGSLKRIIAENKTTPKQKVNIFNYLSTPEYVLEKIGLKAASERIQVAKDAIRDELPKNIEKIVEWKNRVAGSPYATQEIFKYLDGEPIALNANEYQVAQEMKAWLKEWAGRLGLPQDNRIAKYITHIFEKDFVEQEFDQDLAKLIADKVPGSVYDPFLQKRLGKKGYIQDAFLALDAYVKRATRKVHMDPALELLDLQAQKLDLESYKYVQRLASRINLRPTEFDNLVDTFIKSTPIKYKLGQRPSAAITRDIRQMFYRGTLGLNVGSALRNLSQGANTYAKLGEKYTIMGYTKIFQKLITRNLDELYEHGILQNNFIEDRKLGVYKSVLQKLDPVLFSLFDTAEKINRGAAYFGAKSKALKNGATEYQAVRDAKRLVRETQFEFGSVDSPVALSSDWVKTLTQLGTYSIKQIEFLSRMVQNKEFGGLIRYAIASLGFVYTIGRIFGMKPEEVIPSIGLGGSPTGNALSGLFNINSSNEQKQYEAKGKLERAAVSMVPAGVQARKTIQGLNTVDNGRDTTASGRTRFKVKRTPENYIRAGVFGKSALPAAQQYYERLDNRKSKYDQ